MKIQVAIPLIFMMFISAAALGSKTLYAKAVCSGDHKKVYSCCNYMGSKKSKTAVWASTWNRPKNDACGSLRPGIFRLDYSTSCLKTNAVFASDSHQTVAEQCETFTKSDKVDWGS